MFDWTHFACELKLKKKQCKCIIVIVIHIYFIIYKCLSNKPNLIVITLLSNAIRCDYSALFSHFYLFFNLHSYESAF